MKKQWSSEWVRSIRPGKQRKYRYNAPLHVRHRFVSAHLSKALRERFGKRSLPLRKGDEIKVVRGESSGFKGKVERIELKNGMIHIEGLNVKKVDGSEVMKPIHPSNLMITEAKMDDKRRQAVLERKGEGPKPAKAKKDKAAPKEKKEIKKGAAKAE
jgi:large subunit ribosomal protein L24